MATKVVFITTTGAGSFIIPADFGSLVSVEAIGGGSGNYSISGNGGGGGTNKSTNGGQGIIVFTYTPKIYTMQFGGGIHFGGGITITP
jgi:hypothetical protein